MKSFLPRQAWLVPLVGGVLLPWMPAQAIDLPRPGKVVREVRGLIHRAAGELKGSGRSASSRSKSKSVPSKTNKADSPEQPAIQDDGNRGVVLPPLEQITSSPVVDKPAPKTEPDMQTPGNVGEYAPPLTGAAPQDVGVRPTSTAPASDKGEPPVKRRSDADPSLNASNPSVPKQEVEFARPVPGKAGLVYPPGVEESAANIVSVEGMRPGQLARDPRTGKVFRVP